MTPLSDAFLDRLASAAVREGLADAVYTTLSTPIGPLVIVQGAHGVLRIAFEGEPLDHTLARVAAGVGPRIVQSDRELAATRDTLSAYLEGDDDRLELPVDFSLVGGAFRRAVLETLHREVHRGEVVTYGALLRHEPDPDRRALPPRAARLRPPRRLRRRPGAQARAAGARGRSCARLGLRTARW
jgi:methylated-DNA-[protein]-cysteine S-methyltransferase